MKPIKVACVQAAPVFLDLQASLDKAETLVAEAAANGAGLVAFSETWLPGYPWWVWLSAPVEGMAFLPRYHANAITQGDASMRRLQVIARDHRVILSMGYVEKEGGTLYISQVLIDAVGTILQNRRKLKPTHVERTVFGEGDGSDLHVVETDAGRVGALNCWEHVHPLNKMAMYAQHEEIHVAAWPSFALYRDIAYALGPEVNNSVSRVYAVEGSCYVLAPCAVTDQRTLDICTEGDTKKLHLLNPRSGKPGGGFAMIYAPDGREMCERLSDDQEGILYADLDPAMIAIAKGAADPSGHYGRADAVRLVHDKSRRQVLGSVGPQEVQAPIPLIED
jgi:nitrilase